MKNFKDFYKHFLNFQLLFIDWILDKITEYLCEPLRKCLKDEDPYVRKTAAVCVAKLYDISADMVQEQGFLDALKELLSDSNPMVVANAVAALSEIGRDDFLNKGFQ